MATKKPANTSSSETQGAAPSTSRKSVRKADAPYGRKASNAGGGGDGGKKGQNGSNKPEEQLEAQPQEHPQGHNDQPQLDAAAQAGAPGGAQPAQAKVEEINTAMSAEAKSEQPSPAQPAAEAAKSVEPKPEAGKPAEAKVEAAEAKAEAAKSEPAPVEAAKPAEPEAAKPEPVPVAPAVVTELAFAELLPPAAIPSLPPDSPAAAPGKAPPGDSRSFRRYSGSTEEFVLIYRYDAFLITRAGKVGTQGTWSVVEYPHIGAAANAYAHRCSDFRAQGYWDLF